MFCSVRHGWGTNRAQAVSRRAHARTVREASRSNKEKSPANERTRARRAHISQLSATSACIQHERVVDSIHEHQAAWCVARRWRVVPRANRLLACGHSKSGEGDSRFKLKRSQSSRVACDTKHASDKCRRAAEGEIFTSNRIPIWYRHERAAWLANKSKRRY